MKITNKQKGIYLIWVTINFTLLMLSGNIYFGSSDGWYPYYYTYGEAVFSIYLQDTYDLSEFLLYNLVPLLLFVSYKLIKEKK